MQTESDSRELEKKLRRSLVKVGNKYLSFY